MDSGDRIGSDGSLGVTATVANRLVDVPACLFVVERMEVTTR